MTKRILISLGLVVAMALTGCNAVNDGVSDIGSGVSDLTSDLSSGMSDVESDISSGMSDAKSDMQSDMSKDDMESSDRKDSSESTSAPVSGAPSEETGIPEEASKIDIPTSLPATAYDLCSLDNTKQGWGQGVRLDEYNRPEASLLFQEKYGKYNASFIGDQEPVIYLTFDCGYENGNTAPILDTLKEKGVSAVFFVISDYVNRQPELVQRMIEEGHTIGNHSDTHLCMPEQTIECCEQEIMNLHNRMIEDYDYTMTLFRPPAGEFSERTLALTDQLGYRTVFWSYAYADWDPNKQIGPEKALARVTGALHPGAIYLLHAVSPDNAAILGDFIDTAREQGYEFSVLQ
ncbi:MAG: polysaccharide deacetylase family protein [Candidatus Merdivicinus sp.]|jgi:peptidoglycan-N-acetylmuramic acid deacetylase